MPADRPGRRWRHPDDREIVRLALPALGALVAEPIYLLTDTAVVGHIGTEELGGVAVAGTVLTTVFVLFNFLAYGTTAAVARYTGAGQEEAGARHAVQSVWLAGAIGLLLTAVGLAAAGPAADLMGASETVRAHAVLYLRISVLGAPAYLVSLACVGYLRGVQDTAGPLRIALAGNAANLLAEVIFVYGFDMGLAASAWTTVAAQAGAAAVFVRRLSQEAGVAGVPWRPEPRFFAALVRIGRDLFLRTGALLLALALASATAARLGNAELAAHQIAFQLWSFLALVLDAIAIAAQAIVGRLLGAGDATAARAASQRMVQWGLVAGAVFAGVILVLRPVLPELFTTDPAVRAEAVDILWFVAAMQPVNAVVFVLDGVLLGAGDLRFLATAMVGALAAFAPACLLVGTIFESLPALWVAVGVLMVARLAAVVWRFRGSAWAVTGATR
jgi:putative MATE family efflux protein